MSTRRASASRELANSPMTTVEREVMVMEDLICAATSGGKGRIEDIVFGIGISRLDSDSLDFCSA